MIRDELEDLRPAVRQEVLAIEAVRADREKLFAPNIVLNNLKLSAQLRRLAGISTLGLRGLTNREYQAITAAIRGK